MTAIILAAGQGTRLRPYTEGRPKCMVPFLGEPLLHYQRWALLAAGVREIAIVGGFHAEAIVAQGARMFLNPRYDQTNMVYSLFCARELMDGQDDLLICYGDLVYEPGIIHALRRSDADVAVAVDLNWQAYWSLRFTDPLRDAETLRMSQNGRLVEIGKKPKDLDEIQAQYLGLIKVRASCAPRLRQVYDAMPRQAAYDGKSFENMFMTSFIQYLIDQGWDVAGVLIGGGWLEFDSVDDLDLYQRLHSQGRLGAFFDASQMPVARP